MARALRTLLAASLVLAQTAAGSFASEMAARGAPCAVHTALAVSIQNHGSGDHGHSGSADAAGHAHHGEHQVGGDDGNAAPFFSFACCAACAVGLTVVSLPLQTPGWQHGLLTIAVHGLEPGELPSTDPPPRILL